MKRLAWLLLLVPALAFGQVHQQGVVQHPNDCTSFVSDQNVKDLTGLPCPTPDGTTIYQNGDSISAVSGPSTFTVTASTSTTTVTPGKLAQANVAISANTTFTIASATVDGQLLKLRIQQDATGSRTVAFDSSVVFGTTIASFTASTAANAVDYVGLEWDATKGKWVFLAFALGY